MRLLRFLVALPRTVFMMVRSPESREVGSEVVECPHCLPFSGHVCEEHEDDAQEVFDL